jgi:hypothetical protein
MDVFSAIVFGSLVAAFLTFIGLGMLWRHRPMAEITDKRSNERWATQAAIAEHDIPEMVAASNEYRRKRGRPEVTPEEFKRKIGKEQVATLDQANKQIRAKARRGFGRRDRERRGF